MNKQHNEKRGYSNNELVSKRDHNGHVKTNNLAIKVSTKQDRAVCVLPTKNLMLLILCETVKSMANLKIK